MKTFLKNIKSVLIFSDSELLELMLCITLMFINPTYYINTNILTGWCSLGVLGSLFILWGLGNKSIKAREIGLLMALINLTALSIVGIKHGRININIFFQNTIIAFVWWKVGRERIVQNVKLNNKSRKVCNGTK
jgi:hypothetical protein